MPSTASSCATSVSSRSDGRPDLLLNSWVLCALLALSPAQAALAWGPEGHRMVGEIAGRYTGTKANAEILELLKNDSHADVPLCEAAEYSRYCRSGHGASAQLARQIEILGNERARPGQRNEALKWVVHLVADLHQPLHAANRGDRGGNPVQVSFFGERDNPPYGTLNLHAVWDVGMVRRLITDRGGERAIVSAPIADRNRDAWEKGSIPEWTAESHRIARDTVYPLLPVAGACSSKIVGVVAIDQTYYAKVASLIEIQIKKAGVRLARVLNETLGR